MKLEVQIEKNKIFSPILDKMLPLTPDEEVRQEFICDLVNVHGYSINQIGQDLTTDIGIDYTDIAIWRNAIDKKSNKKPSIITVIECKAEYLTIDTQNFKRGHQFATISGAKLFIAKNKKETNVYQIDETAPNTLKELKNFPSANVLKNENSIIKYIEESLVFNREDFSKLLFKCHNIIRNNDKLSPEAAFDEISKILFMKIRFERDMRKERLIFSEANLIEKRDSLKVINPEDSFYQTLFKQTKDFFKDESLFDENEILKIREASFFQIVKELEKYNLSNISDDIKGIAFEQFLGRTFRGELGQFFTPRTVVEFMTEILDPKEGELICDPCCGSGGFLINAFEYVRKQIEKDIQNQKEKLKKNYKGARLLKEFGNLDNEFNLKNDRGRLYNLSHNCIYGTDANPRMARTAKMNMIMHGDGHGGVHHNDGLLDINGIYESRFDLILTNPPFGARVEKSVKITHEDIPSKEEVDKWQRKYGLDYKEKVVKQLIEWSEHDNGKNKPKGKSIVDIFETGKMSALTEILFIERCLNLLKPGGRMGIVLPEGVLNNPNLQKVRDFVESKAKIILITSIPQDVFIASGASVKPSLLFFKKFTLDEEKEWNWVSNRAIANTEKKYANQLNEIDNKLSKRGKSSLPTEDKKELRKQLREIVTKKDYEIKVQIKKDFDYQIPIAEVEKAGISTTGAKIENELEPLSKEFKEFRIENQLW